MLPPTARTSLSKEQAGLGVPGPEEDKPEAQPALSIWVAELGLYVRNSWAAVPSLPCRLLCPHPRPPPFPYPFLSPSPSLILPPLPSPRSHYVF